MPVLSDTTLRFALDQSLRAPMPNIGTDPIATIWQDEPMIVNASLFNGDPSVSTNFVSDISNILAATITVRKFSPNGPLLIQKTITPPTGFDNTTTYATWSAGTNQHFSFQLSATDTNLAVPSDGTLAIFGIISLTTGSLTNPSFTVGVFEGFLERGGSITSSPPGVAYVISLNGASGALVLNTLAGYGITDAVNTTDPRLSDARAAKGIQTSTPFPIDNSVNPTDQQELFFDGPSQTWKLRSLGAGSVISVGLALPPSVFSVTGSPVLTTGTLTGSFVVQNVNQVFAGPPTGSTGVPMFRALVAADIPSGIPATATALQTLTTKPIGNTVDPTTGQVLTFTAGVWQPTTVIPTGTGFTHITGGVLDAAARAVDLSSADATGTLAAARVPAFTGDVTNSAGSLSTTISNLAVTYAKMQNTSAGSVLLGRGVGAAGSPQELTLGAGLTMTTTIVSTPVFVQSGSTHAIGAVPDPGAVGGTSRYLREDATWQVPPAGTVTVTGSPVSGNMTKFSGATSITNAVAKVDYWDTTIFAEGGTHNAGLVPDPGAVSGTTRFLCENGTWTAPAGSPGVPAGGTAGQYLAKIDATNYNTQWVTPGGGNPPGGSTTQVQYNNAGAFGGIIGATTNGTILTMAAGDFALTDALHTNEAAPATPAAGKNMTWTDTTDKRFHDKNDAGTIGTTVVSSSAAANQWANSVSTAGVIGYAQPAFSNLSGTATTGQLPTLPTYAAVGNDFVASGASAAHGLVPTPGTTAGATRFLREDATWMVPAGGGNVSNVGTPTNLQIAQWTSATTIQGLATTGTGNAVLATSPTITTPTIAALPNLSSNGFVKTGGGTGTLSIDTSTYLTANQTITLTGPITGSGATSIATTIGSGVVTNAMLANSSITIAGVVTALGGTITQDQITGLSTTGIVKRMAANTLTIATAKTDYWDTSDFVMSGASGAHGLVPTPGTTAGTTRFLREDATWQVPAGGGTPGAPANSIQFNNAGAFGGSANLTWTNASNLLTQTGTPAANTVVDGYILTDTTAATAGNQQYSPTLHFTGQGWKTTATAASQSVDFRIYNVPVQGAANPTGNLTIDSSVNAGAYGNATTISTTGQLSVNSNATGAVLTLQVTATDPGAGPTNYNSIVFNNGHGAGNFKNQFVMQSAGTAKYALGNDYGGAGVQNFFIWDGGANKDIFQINGTTSIALNNTNVLGWSASDASAAVDTGLARNAAAVVEVNNGTAGTLATLKASTLNATTALQINGVSIFPVTPANGGLPTAGTAGQVLSKIDGTNYNTQWTTPIPWRASLTVENPGTAENICFAFTTTARTITKVIAVVKGTSPSVTYNIGYGTSVATLTNVTTSPVAVTNTTTGTTATLNNTAIPANGFLVFTTSANAGTVTWIHVTVEC
jgi:hypothetical protein